MTWAHDLQALAARFGCCIGADLAAMNCAQLWAVYAFLKAKAEGG
jgi:hypothetical protein